MFLELDLYFLADIIHCMKRWMMEPLHQSYFITAILLGVIAGVLLSGLVVFNITTTLLVYFVLILGFVSMLKRYRLMLVVALAAGLVLGYGRGAIHQSDLDEYAPLYGKAVNLSGVVGDDAVAGPKGDVRLRLHSIVIENKEYKGELWVTLREFREIQRSDTLHLQGMLGEGFGNFAAVLFRAEIVSVAQTHKSDIGLVVRNDFADKVAIGIEEPELSLGLGYLLGLKSALPENLANQFQLLGLTHVVVASGYNLTILVSFARRVFARISKYLATLSGAVMIMGFMSITGLSPSMSRAGLVAGLSLLAWYYGRKIHPVSLLIIAAGVTLLYKPSYIWGDIGWYLSFAAFFGILVLAPLIHSYFWGRDRPPSMLRELVVATFSAQIVTLPIILAVFGVFSWLSIVANALILPVVPLAMLATFVAGSANYILPSLADLIAWPADFLLSYCIAVAQQLARFPSAQSELTINGIQVALAYALMLIIVVWLVRITKHDFMRDKTIVD